MKMQEEKEMKRILLSSLLAFMLIFGAVSAFASPIYHRGSLVV